MIGQENNLRFSRRGLRIQHVNLYYKYARYHVAALCKELMRAATKFPTGYGDLKEKTFRIAHMADATVADVEDLLNQFNDILDLK